MNLDERIEAAWKDHMSRRYYATDRETDDAEDEFTAGYRAAMLSLYVDLDLNMSECIDYEWYWIRTDDGWQQAMRVDFGFEVVNSTGDDLVFSCGQEDVQRVVEVSIPSPAEIF